MWITEFTLQANVAQIPFFAHMQLREESGEEKTG